MPLQTFTSILKDQSSSSQKKKDQSYTYIAFTLESIWNPRNQVEHCGTLINILTTIKLIENRVAEYMNLLNKFGTLKEERMVKMDISG